MWSLIAHLGGIVTYFVAPLIVLLVFKGRGAYVENQAKEALNFQITITIAIIVGFVLAFILVGFLLLAAAGICSIVFGIMAAIAANRGELYRYPISIRLVN